MSASKGLKNVLAKEVLHNLYWKKGLTLTEIAKQFGVKYPTIIYWMEKFGLGRRKQKTYTKTTFNENVVEKAYLIGFRLGDLNVRRHRQQIAVRTSTTHAAMINLFNQLFGKYGRVKQIKIKARNKPYAHYWYVCALLDKSFEFLLQKEIPMFHSDEEFLAFLAGYTDAEGCLCITSNSSTSGEQGIRYIFSIASEDKEVLEELARQLNRLGYRVYPRLSKKEGVGKYKKDYWELRLHSKEEILRLLRILPLRHREKIAWKKLMIEFENWRKWAEVKSEVFTLRRNVEKEVAQCTT